MLKERILRLLGALVVSSHIRLYRDRVQQINDRLDHLEYNFPEDKHTVLPNLRDYYVDPADIPAEIESESEVETLRVDSSEEEGAEEPDPNPFLNPLLRAAWERLQRDPERLRQGREEIRQESLPPSILNLPAHRRTGSLWLGGSSSTGARSSSDPVVGASSASVAVVSERAPKAKAKVQITRDNPLLRRSSASASTDPLPAGFSSGDIQTTRFVHFKNITPSEADRLELQVGTPRQGVANSRAVISWDHHQVLDTFRSSNRRVERDSEGVYPEPTREVLRTVFELEALTQFKVAQIVLSYCHKQETVNSVLRCTSNQPELSGVFVSRRPTGEKGKLAILRRLFSLNSLVYHVDDSPEVLEEIQTFVQSNPQCGWQPIGISVPRKRQIQGVVYYRNIKEAFAAIADSIIIL